MPRRWWARAGLLLLLLVTACGSSSKAEWRRAWTAQWNTRVDAHQQLLDHPCGDFAFDPWVDAFLAPCEPPTAGSELGAGECKARNDWAWERSDQCAIWQAWLLRNVHKHERVEAPEPETRVP